MSEPYPRKPRVSLTTSQIQEGIGAELFSLCQGITADGRLSKDEIVALGLWLHDNEDAHLPGLAFLSETLSRIVADGLVTHDEQHELMVAIERELPPDARKMAKSSRRVVESKRKADSITARKEKRRQELECQEIRQPADEFDFMVAGVSFEGRHRIIEQYLNVGDRVLLHPEPGNPHDECAVAISLTDGQKIGYVPRTDSEDVSGCIEDGGYYVARVKKILTGGRFPVPVVVLQFYRPDQLAAIADIKPDPCPTASPAQGSPGCPRAMAGHSLALPFYPLLVAFRRSAFRFGKGIYCAVTFVVRWVASVKDDLRGEDGRNVNSALLIAKLMIIATVSGVLFILLIKLMLLAVSLRA